MCVWQNRCSCRISAESVLYSFLFRLEAHPHNEYEEAAAERCHAVHAVKGTQECAGEVEIVATKHRNVVTGHALCLHLKTYSAEVKKELHKYMGNR